MPVPVVAIVGAGQAGFQVAASLHQEGFAGRVTSAHRSPNRTWRVSPVSMICG